MEPVMDPVYFLLVDDLEDNLVSLEALLRRDGLELLKARSGEEALELLLRHDVALGLLDVQMPGMDGFELAELMRGNDRTRHVPIIFLTASASDNQRKFRGYEAGAVDFIQKPIEWDILRSKSNVFFDLHRQRQQHYLTQNIIQVEAGAIVVCHFARLFLNGFFSALFDLLGRQILKIEIFFNQQLRCFEAAVASRFYGNSQRAANSHLT